MLLYPPKGVHTFSALFKPEPFEWRFRGDPFLARHESELIEGYQAETSGAAAPVKIKRLWRTDASIPRGPAAFARLPSAHAPLGSSVLNRLKELNRRPVSRSRCRFIHGRKNCHDLAEERFRGIDQASLPVFAALKRRRSAPSATSPPSSHYGPAVPTSLAGVDRRGRPDILRQADQHFLPVVNISRGPMLEGP
jgi:hypothetical protein